MFKNIHNSEKKFEEVVQTNIPSTQFGTLKIMGFQKEGTPALAIVSGELSCASIPIVRVHSQCLFGEVFHSLKCDCLDQLHASLEAIRECPPGMVIYLYQEGRGAGIINKIKGYDLSEKGLDTVEAYESLDLPIDQRDYSIAADILKHFNIAQVQLMTNNPDKVSQLEKNGIEVAKRIPIEVSANPHDFDYLRTKKIKMNHMLALGD